MLALQVNWHTTQLRIVDEITPRRERAYNRSCRWTTLGIKTQRFWLPLVAIWVCFWSSCDSAHEMHA